MPAKPIAVVETKPFERSAAAIWAEAERAEFVDFIARNPEAGDVIPDTGGVRKIRWMRQGSGKRGGARIIYFYHRPEMPLYLLLIYAKAQRTDMTPEEKKVVRRLAGELKARFGS